MCAAMLGGMAQMLPGSTRLPSLSGGGVNMDFLRNALEQNMVVVRSQYLLVDNAGGYYGYAGDSIFGECFNVAIKCGRSLVGYRNILNPWEVDRKFDSYSQSTEYRPMLSTVKVSPAGGELSYVPYWYDLTTMSQRYERNSQDNVLTILNDSTAYGSLTYLSADSDHLRGFIVWASVEDADFGISHARLKLSFSAPELTFDNGVSQAIDRPLGDNSNWAFYIVPKALPNGMVQLCLSGVVFRKADDNEKVYVCAIDNPVGLMQGAGLTPVNQQMVLPSQPDPTLIQDI